MVDANGIGYHLHISVNTYAAIQSLDQAKLFTYMAVRDDAHLLYGFYEEEERDLFLHLISVSGLAPAQHASFSRR